MVSWLVFREEPVDLLVSKKLRVETFTDQGIDGGRSKILKHENKPAYNSILFDLEEGFISPYAGLTLFHEGGIDVSKYTHLEVSFELKNTKNLELTIATFQNGVTKEHEPLSFRHNIQEIPIHDQRTTANMSLEKMHVAQWWLERYKVTSTELGEANWARTASLSFVAKIQLDETKPQLLKINGVVFYKDLTAFYVVASVFLVCWYLLFFLRKKVKTEKSSDVVIKYEQIKTSSSTEASVKEEDFFDYIVTNYSDSGLTLGKLSKELGISEKVISAAIKEAYSQTFKEFLNGIRLAEAKRLMLESESNISEIAYQVGFNSPNHFNRTFKSYEGITPTEFIRNRKGA